MRFYNFFLVILLFFILTINKAYADFCKNDSIVNSLLADSTKVNLLLKSATQLRVRYPDSALSLLNKAILVADKKELRSKMVSAYRIKGVVFLVNSKFDSAIVVYNKTVRLAKKYSFTSILIKAYENMGILYSQMGDYDKAFLYYSLVLNNYSSFLNDIEKSNLLNNLGLMYTAKSDYINAMDSHQKALMIRERNNDSLGLASSMMNIANIYFYQEKYSNAIAYYKNAVEIFINKNASYNIGQCYHNIGTIYEKIDSLDKAEFYLKKSINYESTIGGKAKYLNMIGLVTLKQGKYQEAEKYFNEALNIHRKIDSKVLIIPVLNNLASLYNKMNLPTKSLIYTKESLSLCYETNSKEFEKDALLNYSLSLEKKGNLRKALDFYKRYTALKDSLFGKEKYKQIQELEIKYETAKKETKLELQRVELAKKELEAKKKDAIIKKEQVQKYAFLIITLLLIIIFIIEVINQRQKRKSSLQLIVKNEELNNQKIKELIKKHQLDSVKSRLEAEENERHRIAQELHDGIGGSLAAIKLYVDSLRKNSDLDELDLVYENINKTYEEVRALSHNLTPPAFEFTAINEIVKDYVEQISRHSKLEIVVNSNVQSNWSAVDELIQVGIFRISQELINNVIKHAQATRVEISLNLSKEYVEIKVADNGVGFDVSKKTSGIGVRNIKERVANLKGEIYINSEIGKGTEVMILIPVD